MKNNKREYCVGVKIINCFYVEAENRDEAELIVREMDSDEILLDSDLVSNMLIPQMDRLHGR
jgi:hypothetical protein